MSYRDEMMEAVEKEVNGLKFSQSSAQVELAEAAARVAFCESMAEERSDYSDYWDGEMEKAHAAYDKLRQKLYALRERAAKAAVRLEEQRILTDIRDGKVQLARVVDLAVNGKFAGQILAPVNVAKLDVY